MEVRLESSDGPRVASPSEAIDHFAKQTRLCQTQWARRLADDFDAFAQIEQEVVVQIDGGRLRLRQNKKRPQKQRRRKGHVASRKTATSGRRFAI